MRRLIAAATTVLALAAAVPVAGASRATAQAPPPLAWTPCPGGQGTPDGGECTTVTVPLDSRHPRNGKTAGIALFRVPARDPGTRIGSLVVNPGGPGASGAQFVRDVYDLLPDELRDRFDIVGFDPRGTGASMPVDCGDVVDTIFGLDYSPDSPEERTALVDGTKAVVGQCRRALGSNLRFVSSPDTVRDLERIRRALGDEQLTFLGYSYGTYLGALYADRYPARVRALLLDGAIDPRLSSHDAALQQAVGFEQSLDTFFDFCATTRRCAFGGADPGAAFDELTAAIDAAPPTTGDGRALAPGMFFVGVIKALYDGHVSYPELDAALAAARDGDAAPMLSLYDQYTRRDDPANANVLEAFWAIGCRDGRRLAKPGGFAAFEPEFAAAAPHLGVQALSLGLVCASWPAKPVASPLPLDAKGAPPILVIGTVGDPATPVQWAHALADELDSGVLLETDGGRHASFVLGRLPCVDDAGVRYLVDLTVPPPGTRCSA